MSERYDYREAVKSSIKEWLKENGERYADDDGTISYDAVYDDMFVDDSVTGNGCGSFTCNTWKAEENLCHNTDLLGEALEEFGNDGDFLKRGAEACDVTIRCYLLGQLLNECLDEYNEAHEKHDEEDD